ncbi:ribosome maturation factor RimM, partial [Calditrichota bacterium]
GEFYVDDIIGCEVSCEGTKIGKLTEVIQQGHHDLWVVKGNDDEYLIPAVREYIDSVSINESQIKIKTIEGLRSRA